MTHETLWAALTLARVRALETHERFIARWNIKQEQMLC